MSQPAFPFARPLYVMAKPAGSMCNLRCTYCYYLEKKSLFGRPAKMEMSDEVLERYIEQYIAAQSMPAVMFTWHGGEPLLRPLSFYRKVVKLQRKYARGIRVDNSIQTNGTLLTDELCRFFKDNGWLVGLSIDGPREFHDRFRVTAAESGSYDRVMRGIELLNRHGVEWNAMAVVNGLNADHPDEFYDFFKSIGCRFIQFTPIVERIVRHNDGRYLATPSNGDEAVVAPFSVTPAQWGNFLCRVFDRWVTSDVGEVFVQIFDATLANWVGVEPGLCTMGRYCGHAAVMEHNGDLYSCDHFVFPEYKLGNIKEHNIVELMTSDRQSNFGSIKRGNLPPECLACTFTDICNGECPKNRFAMATDGTQRLNYLCEGYKKYFGHVAPYMEYMKGELAAQRPPSNVMHFAATHHLAQ